MGKLNLYDKITLETRKKRENMEMKKVLHNSPSKRWYRNGIHSLLKRADARGNADITHRVMDNATLRVYFAGQALY